jgi:hypothetical protein
MAGESVSSGSYDRIISEQHHIKRFDSTIARPQREGTCHETNESSRPHIAWLSDCLSVPHCSNLSGPGRNVLRRSIPPSSLLCCRLYLCFVWVGQRVALHYFTEGYHFMGSSFVVRSEQGEMIKDTQPKIRRDLPKLCIYSSLTKVFVAGNFFAHNKMCAHIVPFAGKVHVIQGMKFLCFKVFDQRTLYFSNYITNSRLRNIK